MWYIVSAVVLLCFGSCGSVLCVVRVYAIVIACECWIANIISYICVCALSGWPGAVAVRLLLASCCGFAHCGIGTGALYINRCAHQTLGV